jgi:hypothetical protein
LGSALLVAGLLLIDVSLAMDEVIYETLLWLTYFSHVSISCCVSFYRMFFFFWNDLSEVPLL